MKKLGIALSCALLIGTVACGKPPVAADTMKTGNKIKISVDQNIVVADLGHKNGRTISIKLNSKGSAFKTQSIVHPWVSADVFQYDLIISKDGQDLGTVSVFPKSYETGAKFTGLQPNASYTVRVVAKGNIGGLAADTLLNNQHPSSETFDFNPNANGDYEDTISKTITVILNDIDFNGNADVGINTDNGGIVGSNGGVIGNIIDRLWNVSTFAGSTWGYADGQGVNAQFHHPSGVAVDSAGNIYVAEMFNSRIRKISPDGTVSTFAGSGSDGYADGQGLSAQFTSPKGLDVDAEGNLYVADDENNRIRKITPDGTVSTFAGSGSYGNADGQGTSAQFKNPTDLDVDASGNIFVADYGNNCIRKITPGGMVSTVNNSYFSYPSSIAVDTADNIYVGDGLHCIQKLTPNGTVSTIAGNGTQGYADGQAASAQFTLPMGLDIDRAGNIYVADYNNNRIRKITQDGNVSTIAGNGTQGYADGQGDNAQLALPRGVVVDATGNIFVADMYNNRVRKLTPN